MKRRCLGVCGLVLAFSACGESTTTTPVGPVSVTPATTPPATTPSPGTAAAPSAAIVDVQPSGIALAHTTVVGFAGAARDPNGYALTYTWDFGDKDVETGDLAISHVFEKAGIYHVTLTVDNGHGGTGTAVKDWRVDDLNGNWQGTIDFIPQARIFAGHVTQTGRSFSAGIGFGHIEAKLFDPYSVTITFDEGLCGNPATRVYKGSVSDSIRLITATGPDCAGETRNLTMTKN